MNAVDAMIARHAARQNFAGVALAAFDHTLATSGALARGFSRSGIPPGDVYWLGKAYSDRRGVIDEMRGDGFHFMAGERTFKCGFLPPLGDPSFVLTSSDPDQYVRRALALAVRKTPNQTLLVIDDDGRFIQMLHTEFREALPRAVGVSRTRRVSVALATMKLEMPVVDLGQAWVKDRFESPSIGRSIGQAAEEKTHKLRDRGVEVGQRVGIVGAGVIGTASARYLRDRDFDVELYDVKPAALEHAIESGFVVHQTLPSLLARTDILLSTTGNGAVKPSHLKHLPNGAVLLNGASGQSEVRASSSHYARAQIHPEGPRFYGLFRGKHVLLGDSRDPESLDTIIYPGNGNELYLARDGSVINFNYGATPDDPIPARYIQITRGATYLAGEQAVSLVGKPGGLYEMNRKDQRKLAGLVESELRLSGESLLRPSF